MLPPLSRAKTLAYACGSFAAGTFLAFITYTFPFYLTENHLLIGWLAITRFLPVIQPIVGIWSDRARFGRAPLFLAAMPIAAVLLLLSGLVAPEPSSITIIVVAIFASAFFFNVGINPYTALLADVTPSEQRGTVSGTAQALGFLGQVTLLVGAFFLYEYSPVWVFGLVALGMAVGFGIVAFGVRESRTGVEIAPPRGSGIGFNRYILGLMQEHPDAMKLLGTRLLYQLGIGAVLAFLAPFIATEIGLNGWGDVLAVFSILRSFGLEKIDPQGLAQMMAGVFLLATGVFAFPCGLLGDRIGKKTVFGMGLLVCGVTSWFAASAANVPQTIGYMVLLGFGNAALSVLFFPYLTDLIPPQRVGEFAGLSALVETVGAFLAFPIAGWFVNLNLFHMQYRLVFIVTTAFLLVAFISGMFVKSKLEFASQQS